MICPKCNGNGYLGDSTKENEQTDCVTCDNQGEIEINDDTLWNKLQFDLGVYL